MNLVENHPGAQRVNPAKLTHIQVINVSGSHDLYLTDTELLKNYTQEELDDLVEGGFVWRRGADGLPVESHRDIDSFAARCERIEAQAKARFGRTTMDDVYEAWNRKVDIGLKLTVLLAITGILCLMATKIP